MALINTITILATVDTSGMVKGLKQSADAVNNFGKQVQSTAGTLKAVGAAFAGAWLTGKAVGAIKEGMEAIDGIRIESERLGASVENLSQFTYAAEIADVPIETLYGSMEKLNKNLGEVAMTGKGPAKDALDQMGLSAQELTSMDLVDATEKILIGLSNIENPAQRARAAVELFGKSGQAMLNLAAQGAAGLKGLRREASDFGVAITAIDASKIDAAGDAITRLSGMIGGLAKQVAIGLSPYLTTSADQLREWGTKGVTAGNLVKNAFLNVEKAIGFVIDALEAIKINFQALQSPVTSWSSTIVGAFAKIAEKADSMLAKMGMGKTRSKKAGLIDFLKTWSEDLGRLSESQGKAFQDLLTGPSWRERFERKLADVRAEFEKQAAEAAKKKPPGLVAPLAAAAGPAAALKPVDLAANKALVAGSTEFANFVLRTRFGAGGRGDATREIAANTKTQVAQNETQIKLLTDLVAKMALGQSLNVITSI